MKPAKEPERRLCRGELPLYADIQSSPLQPEPPNMCSRFSNTIGERGGPGGIVHFRFPPASLRRFRRAKAASERNGMRMPRRFACVGTPPRCGMQLTGSLIREYPAEDAFSTQVQLTFCGLRFSLDNFTCSCYHHKYQEAFQECLQWQDGSSPGQPYC